jgi:autotransporter adhesin
VAAGRIGAASTDAVNGSQLYAVTQSLESLSLGNAAHYFSVNDGGSPRTNYINDGATAPGALAAGVSARASSTDGVALGEGSVVDAGAGTGSIALGSGAVADRGLAPAAGSITAGSHLIPYNTTDRMLAGALSVGSATTFRQITNVADGTADQDAVTLRQLKGALVSFAVTPTAYFHANSTAPDSLAVGAEAVAIGPRATVDGDRGIGLGQGATVQQTAPGGTAIGEDAAVTLADGVALGTRATSNAVQGVAIGAGAVAGVPGSVALGAGSTTEGAVATTGATLAGSSFAFAGAAPSSTVSIGTSGAERTLTHLAAGQIAADSTDGINGSQLFATNQTVEALHAQLGSLATALGNLPPAAGTEVLTFASSRDNTSTATASGSDSTAVGAGAVATGDNSVALGAGSIATQPNTVSVGSIATQPNTVPVGSIGHERTITHVSPGVDPTDAVNVGQLSDAVANAKDWSRSYTDQRFATVDRDLNRIGNRANAGIASAMAMAGLPQAYGANQNSAGIALGTFHGESSVAVGLSAITESGRYIFKLSASTNSRGDAGASVGAGVVW